MTARSAARQIAVSAGEYGSVIVGKLLKKDQYNYGFDSQTCGYGNLVTKGIVDPTEVVRSAAARCLKKMKGRPWATLPSSAIPHCIRAAVLDDGVRPTN